MKWSWRIARFAGIDVFLHATFLIFLAWIAVVYWNIGQSLNAVLSGVAFVLVLFACVVLHEFGHALTARRFGIGTKNITLLPIGGVASLEKLPEDPWQEIAVAIAGPMVNIVIALALWAWIRLNDLPLDIEQINLADGFSIGALLIVNIVLVAFNMLPAFPMDGGRVFRASLALAMPRDRATEIAAATGRGFAIFFGILGLFYNPFLVVIAVFIWIGANSESGMEMMKSRLFGVSAGQAMLTEFHALSPADPLSNAMSYTLSSNQVDFPVIANGQVQGVLTQVDLVRGLKEADDTAQVERFMRPDLKQIEKDQPVQRALETLLSSRDPLLAVTEKGQFIGILDMQNIMELVNFKAALRS